MDAMKSLAGWFLSLFLDQWMPA